MAVIIRVVYNYGFDTPLRGLLNHRVYCYRLHTVAHSAQALNLIPLKYTGRLYHKEEKTALVECEKFHTIEELENNII